MSEAILLLEIKTADNTICLSTNDRHLMLKGIQFLAKEYHKLETRGQMERTILDFIETRESIE